MAEPNRCKNNVGASCGFFEDEEYHCILASLTNGGDNQELTDVSISSLIDTWLLLRDIEMAVNETGIVYS